MMRHPHHNPELSDSSNPGSTAPLMDFPVFYSALAQHMLSI